MTKISATKTSATKISATKKSVPPIVYIVLVLLPLLVKCSFKPALPNLFTPNSTGAVSSPLQSDDRSLMTTVSNVPAGTYRYGGSTSWATIRKEVDPVIRFNFSRFQTIYVNPEVGGPSSERGLTMLLEGKLDFVQSSQGVSSELRQRADQLGIKLKEIAIATDAIALVVHPDLNIPGLELAQIDAIKAGRIANWNEVGGPNLAIQIFSKDGDGLNGVEFTPVSNSTDAFRQISQTPGGLYWASASLAVPQCGVKTLPIAAQDQNWIPPYQQPLILASDCIPRRRNQVNSAVIQAGQYPLLRRLTVVVVEDGGDRQKAGEAYANMLLTEQGQALIRKAGYSSL
jgi:phosphate transport system substrate-binding protein